MSSSASSTSRLMPPHFTPLCLLGGSEAAFSRAEPILKAMGTSDRAIVGVFVFEGGLIVEQGRHEELLKDKNSVYKKLYKLYF